MDEQHEDDNDDDVCKIESAQPASDTFCEPVPELSRKLQLEHHQCVRLLKAVYGLVNAPRRWYDRVATDLGNMRGEESLMEPCLWTFRDENGVIHALCLVFVDDFMLVTLHLENMSSTISSVHAVRCTNHTSLRQNTPEHGADLRSVSQNTRKKFRSSPCHHIDAETEKSEITPLELSQLRGLNGQFLWFGMQFLPQLLAGHLLRDECRQFDNAFEEKGMLRQTTLHNVSLHLHAKFQKCHLKIDAVSAVSQDISRASSGDRACDS